jgi:DNA-binding response OmpR family regulator
MNDMISILVVDDSPEILHTTSRLLKSAGYSVLEASSGADCLESVRACRPDLVLLDVHLPDVLGYEVCRRIKDDKDLRGTYVVMLSGVMVSSDHQSDGLDEGADGYIIRPVPNRELLARLQSISRIIKAEHERDQVIRELQHALTTIKTLRGMLPICSNCKKIRDDKGYWEEVELYVIKHTDAEFTHGICPECERLLYKDMMDEKRD